MSDYTIAPSSAANPYTPSGALVFNANLRSDTSPANSFRAAAVSSYVSFVHDANYGNTIVSTGTMTSAAALHDSDFLMLGNVVRSGANAGAFIGVRFNNTATPVAACTLYSPTGTPTSISSNAAFPATPAASDVYVVTVVLSGGTFTISATQNGSAFTFSANTTTTYATESVGAGGAFLANNNNTTRLAQFDGTGVSASGAKRRYSMSGGLLVMSGGLIG